jgi:hypothetical protein
MGVSEMTSVANDLEKGPPRPENHSQLQRETRKICPSIYHDEVVKPKLQLRPWLESLNRFMDPDADGFAMDKVDNMRMEHFDIIVIHVPQSGKPYSVVQCDNVADFEATTCEDKERAGTLIIAKGISRAVIETLGTRFELEPEFFAQYLKGTELYLMGTQTSKPPARSPNLLPDYIRKAPFYTADYRRPLYIEDSMETVIQVRATATTTPRGVQVMHKDSPDVFVAERISVYKKKGSKVGKS